NRHRFRTQPSVLFAQRGARDRPRTIAEALGHGTPSRARRQRVGGIHRGLGRSYSASGRECRHRRNDLDLVQHSRRPESAPLQPGGRLLFVEHGRAPDPNVIWWQDRLTPVWKRLGGGCHLNRAIGTLIEGAGFQFDRLETGYMRGPKPMTFMYEGSARLR